MRLTINDTMSTQLDLTAVEHMYFSATRYNVNEIVILQRETPHTKPEPQSVEKYCVQH